MLYKLLSFGLWFLVVSGILFLLLYVDIVSYYISRILFLLLYVDIVSYYIGIVYITSRRILFKSRKLTCVNYISRILFIIVRRILLISRILFILHKKDIVKLYDIDGVVIDKTSINMQITDVSRITSLIFHVKACRDAHFLFYSDLYQLVKIVILGSSGNCDIRPGFYSYENYKRCIVDCYQFKPFWISWQSNYMRLGYGNIVDQQIVVSGTSPLTFDIAYLSVMRYENFSWEIEYPGNNTGIQDFKFIRHTNTRSMSILSVQTTRSVSMCGISCKLSTDCFGFNYNPSLSYDNCELLTSFQLIDKNNPELQLQIIHPYDWNLYITKFP
ncbi:hypothetical protein LOTGIDRAFT_169232 [Lottia gigantea]|uniref:Farnesoic acid O-methyl transferase domain-containing protein n=1 Tax=Lottia gigantea TaxID=225164 RepID=V4B511_LOTGI|nr:hypothetical protein LOTGIDRAFT_169232 [Lottia gigantea]ESO83539.1 hypothetical protein LOTGIDRAFT_169232 [Lottia gigantea]